MKIRNGFVSNSSSSSFVVVFPNEPKSRLDVQKILFGDKEYYFSPYNDDQYATHQVSKTVWNDIQSQEKNNYEGAIEAIIGGWFDGNLNYDDFIKVGTRNDIDWDAYEKENEKVGKKLFKELFNSRKLKLQQLNGLDVDKTFYIFSYADDDGVYGSALEHGDLFDNLRHIKISYH